jgi:hypothetical protein
MSYGDQGEVVGIEGNEHFIKFDDDRLDKELELINKLLEKKGKKVIDLGQEDDELRFELVDLS